MKIKEIKFLRFGNLGSYKQPKDRYKDEELFHGPPVKKGFYAMPYPYYNLFLLGSTLNPDNISGKTAWLKDENGNLIEYSDENVKYDIDTDKYVYSKKIIEICKKNKIKLSSLYSFNKEFINADNKKTIKTFITYLKKPKIFKYNGLIWSHLKNYAKPYQIIKEKKSWILTTYDDYLDIFGNMLHIDLRNSLKDLNDMNADVKEVLCENQKNPYKKSYKGFKISTDTLEVFIEKI